MMSIDIEIEILELAADLIACGDHIATAISVATDRVLPPPNYKYADYVTDRIDDKEYRWMHIPLDDSTYADQKLRSILRRIEQLKREKC